MRWTTWENISVDRQACAWFIKKYVDDDVVFSFVSRESVIEDKDYAFDTPTAKWTHKQGHSTFYMFVKSFFTEDVVLRKMAEVIDGADAVNDILPPPESYGLEAICIGIRACCADDHETLQKSSIVFDSLYEYMKRR